MDATMPRSRVGWLVKIARVRKGINASLTNYGRARFKLGQLQQKKLMRSRQNSGRKPDVLV
jgi:hypothetical protein